MIVPLIQGDLQDQWLPVTLEPGTYHVSLVAGSPLAGILAGNDSPDLASGDQELAQFTVLGKGPTLSDDAINLGTIGTHAKTELGLLNPDDYQSAVALYKITLAPGQFWQLELAVSAQGIGSPLLPALTLFDADGNVLTTRDSGSGSFTNPSDPFIITGLKPGTYYVGISGAGNLPNLLGGYNPVDGTPGTAGRAQPGGPFQFQFNLVAAPVVKSITLVNFNLGYGDPLDPTPTELNLTFSGPIDLSGLLVPDQQQSVLDAVHSSGRSWPMTAVGYDAAEYRLTFLFDAPLPAGTYSLIVPSERWSHRSRGPGSGRAAR